MFGRVLEVVSECLVYVGLNKDGRVLIVNEQAVIDELVVNVIG